MTDPKLLGEFAYINTSNLDRRKALYQFTVPHFIIEDEIIKLCRFKDGQSLLDVGCGTGKLLLKTAGVYPGSTFAGLDISGGMFEVAQEKAQQNNLSSIQFQKGDVQNIPFPSNSFDRVVAMHMLYHANDIDKALSEISRVLKPEGMVVITANSMHSRIKLGSLKDLAAHLMNREVFTDPNKRFNLEIGPEMVQKYFSYVLLKVFESTLHLKDSQPYIQYFDSLKSFWQPTPNYEEWEKVMLSVQKYIEEEIASAGEFTDNTGFGVIIGSNSPILENSH